MIENFYCIEGRQGRTIVIGILPVHDKKFLLTCIFRYSRNQYISKSFCSDANVVYVQHQVSLLELGLHVLLRLPNVPQPINLSY